MVEAGQGGCETVGVRHDHHGGCGVGVGASGGRDIWIGQRGGGGGNSRGGGGRGGGQSGRNGDGYGVRVLPVEDLDVPIKVVDEQREGKLRQTVILLVGVEKLVGCTF